MPAQAETAPTDPLPPLQRGRASRFFLRTFFPVCPKPRAPLPCEPRAASVGESRSAPQSEASAAVCDPHDRVEQADRLYKQQPPTQQLQVCQLKR